MNGFKKKLHECLKRDIVLGNEFVQEKKKKHKFTNSLCHMYTHSAYGILREWLLYSRMQLKKNVEKTKQKKRTSTFD